jgi:hypothetical protein
MGKKSGIRIGNEQHGSYFRELRNNLILNIKHIFTILKLLNFIHSFVNKYEKIDFFCNLKVTENFGMDPHPDPYQNVIDLEHWLHLLTPS